MTVAKRDIGFGCLVLGLPWLITAALVVFGIIARPERFLDWFLLITIGPLIALLIVIVLNAFVKPRQLRAKPPGPILTAGQPPLTYIGSRPPLDLTGSAVEAAGREEVRRAENVRVQAVEGARREEVRRAENVRVQPSTSEPTASQPSPPQPTPEPPQPTPEPPQPEPSPPQPTPEPPRPVPTSKLDSSTNLQGATERNSANRLRVDAAVPDRVVVMRPFVLAVAVRRSSSPVLREDGLTNTRSGTANVRWPILRKGVQIRIEVSAPDCQIVGNASAQFLLRKGADSPVFYFQLIPGRAGDIGIVIKVFQQEEWLGSARVHTSAHETEIGKVELSIASVSVLSESETRSSRHSAYYVPTHVEVELGELQKKYGILTRRIQAIDTDISRATSTLDRQVLEERRSDFYRERRDVANEMSRLESLTGRQLADFPEPAEVGDERDD